MLTESLETVVPMIDPVQTSSGDTHPWRVFLFGRFAHSIVTLRMPLIRKIWTVGRCVFVGAMIAQYSREHLALLAA